MDVNKIEKSSRHSKIAGDFGESLFLYWLSKRGYESALVDHTGIDLIAYEKKTGKRIGISVKTRTRKLGTEKEGIYVKKSEINKIKNACVYFACKPYFGIVVDRANSIDAILAPLEVVLLINGIGKTYLNIKLTEKYLDKYKQIKDGLIVRFEYSEFEQKK